MKIYLETGCLNKTNLHTILSENCIKYCDNKITKKQNLFFKPRSNYTKHSQIFDLDYLLKQFRK